jgi:hypothetical protein
VIGFEVADVSSFAPMMVTAAKVAFGAWLAGCVVFWRVAHHLRVKAYGPGGGRK